MPAIVMSIALALQSCPAQDDGPHLGTGIKIGEVRCTSAIVWARLTRSEAPNVDGAVFEQVARDAEQLPQGAQLAQMRGAVPGMAGELRVTWWPAEDQASRHATPWRAVTPLTDHACQFELDDLLAGSEYRLLVEGRDAARDTTCHLDGRFRTAPLPEDAAATSFCVVTGQDYHRRDDPARGHRIYDHMLGLDPDFLVHTGDTVYYDKARPFATTVELARFKWNRIYGLPAPREFHRQVACYFQKDDHDTLKDDCWPGQHFGAIGWERGLALYREQLPVSDPPYRRIRWGRDLEIWLVEGREYRSANPEPDGPDKTIWGAAQKRWVMETMQTSTATFRVLISPTPIVGPDRKAKNDNHANLGFTHEGAELREFLASVPNTVVICGDRHWQYVSRDSKTGLREFSCGPMSDAHAGGFRTEDRSEMHEYLAVCGGFLQVQVELLEKGARLHLRHRDTKGMVLNEVVLDPQ